MELQRGRCAYCGMPVWDAALEPIEAFRRRYGLSIRLARTRQSTAEHVVPRCEGGGDADDNIVAACRDCNERRHQRKTPLDAFAYFMLIQRRLAAGRWLRTGLRERLIPRR